jgi:hypothetical protein
MVAMAGKCVNHPSNPKKENIDGRDYCETCVTGIKAARKKVDKHVEPKDCFVWYVGGKLGFQPMPGTGCAHWVAHVKGWKASKSACHAGYPVRVKDVLKGLKKIPLDKVKKGDLWADDKLSHCGLVDRIDAGKTGEAPVITIENCSSKQGGVKKNDWAKYFKSGGSFYR